MTTKPWAGRFEKATDKLVEAFTASIQTDQRMARHDIVGSIAHVRMLGRQGIITTAEQEAIAQGLRAIWRDLQSGARELSAEYEDVHMNVETLLSDRVGAVGGKLHTARSRNDQVALDARLYARELIADTVAAVCGLQAVLAELAERHSETIFPGYTHLQRAQPVVLGHHFLAYFEMLERDQGRLRDCYARANVLPLGSGALAGVALPHRPGERGAGAGLRRRNRQQPGRSIRPGLHAGVRGGRQHLHDAPLAAGGGDRAVVEPGVRAH